MKRKHIFRMNLVFYIPFIILSFLVWKDYSEYVTDTPDRLQEARELYYLDGGGRLVVVADGPLGLQASLYDTATRKLLEEVPLRSDIHRQLAAAYQKGKLVVATNDNRYGLTVSVIDPADGWKQLVSGNILLDSFLSSAVHVWQGRLIIAGDNSDAAVNLGVIQDAQLRYINLNGWEGLPSRPVTISEVMGGFDTSAVLPMFETRLKDDRTAIVSGLLNEQNEPAVRLNGPDETGFEAQDQAALAFAEQFGLDAAHLIIVDNAYPKQARLYNAITEEEGALLPTPEPLYQALLFPLNDEELLIAGSTAEDELKGSVAGYLYNKQTQQFTDVSPFVSRMSYAELDNSGFNFFKENGDGVLYASGASWGAGWLRLEDLATGQITADEAEQWQLQQGEDTRSAYSFFEYVKSGSPLVWNWLAWLVIPLGMTVLGSAIARIAGARHAKQVAEGVLIQGTVIRISETGTRVNDRPVAEIIVRFTDQEQQKEVKIRQIISYLSDIREGTPVMISYNRSNGKAVFVTEADVPEQQLQIIHSAVLKRTDNYGQVNRGQALLLHFEAEGQGYDVPVVQAIGFEYRIGEKANLVQTGGITRLFSYGVLAEYDESQQLLLDGQIIEAEALPATILGRQLHVMEVLVAAGANRVKKINSLFVPQQVPVSAGITIPVTVRRDEFARELRLLRGKQGAARVRLVEYNGTTGERPMARILLERDGKEYQAEQSIEPVYGVAAGDELWIAYDEESREALILNYAGGD